MRAHFYLLVIVSASTLVSTPGAQAGLATQQKQYLIPFVKRQLTKSYYSEGAAIGDFNRDGKPDLVSGPYWYEGPAFTKRHAIFTPWPFSISVYSTNSFFAFPDDFNKDGFDDVLVVGFPGGPAHWYENPRRPGPLWRKHLVYPTIGMESPHYSDITANGVKELVCSSGGRLGYLSRDTQNPTRLWTFHPLSKKGPWTVFIHGLGGGDISGDGRPDVLTQKGWFEQPKSLLGDPPWAFHANAFGNGIGGGQMYAYDVDGDGDNDVVTSINGHGYGLSWFEHKLNSAKAITFTEHVILPPIKTGRERVQFSQLHALQLRDMDGDGLRDIVTGKTYWAHIGNDPGARDPAVLYWFKLERKGGVRFTPQLIDSDSGIGRQFAIGDLNGDKIPDIVIGNKKGCFVFFKIQ